ncbi:hypothetical protein [Streptomyces sp. 3211]|uniref:hypothetical protein n=1 Tax=Streptomyces sp. 3211 TaxID=1964449 RepID=UPI0017B72A8A|nr:hypothetical protein [Streptomyces sp. 3211]
MRTGAAIDGAEELLAGELRSGRRAGARPDTEGAWRAFLRFARRPFDVPDAPDADGLLFQYGTHAFDGPPMFTLDLTRQFGICDDDGDHDHFVQVHCELRYAPGPALDALGSFGSWFFHDSGDDLDSWARALTERPAWAVLGGLEAAGIRVYAEQV